MATLKKQDPQDLDVNIIGEPPAPLNPARLRESNRFTYFERNRSHLEQNSVLTDAANRPLLKP